MELKGSTPEERHEIQRRELWIKIATSVARAEDCKNPEAPIRWANKAVEGFDEKFPVTKL